MFNEIIAKDSQKYLNYIDYKKAAQYITDTVNLFRDKALSTGITIRHMGQILHFKIPNECANRNIQVVVSKNYSNVDAWYKFGEKDCCFGTYINSHVDGHKIHADIVHEVGHSLQDDILKTINQYQENSPEYDFLYKLQSTIVNKNIKRNIFGIEYSGRVYVNCQNGAPSVTLSDLSMALYKLSISERYASALSNKYSAELIGGSKHDNEEYVNLFRDRYGLNDASEQEIFMIVDLAHVASYNGIIPNNPILASVSYDLAATLSYQEGKISDKEYIHIMRNDVKFQKISKYAIENQLNIINYNNLTFDLSISDYIDINKLSNASPEQRLNNPHLILLAAQNYGVEAIALAPDINIFINYYEQHRAFVDEELTLEIDQYLKNKTASIVNVRKHDDKCKYYIANINISAEIPSEEIGFEDFNGPLIRE